MGAADDNAGPRFLRFGIRDGVRSRSAVVAVNLLNVPVIRFEPLLDVVRVCKRRVAFDGDVVVIVQNDYAAQPQCPASAQDSWLTPSIRSPSLAIT